jgi:hypothetical protein
VNWKRRFFRPVNRRVWFHRGGAAFWTLMAIPAFLWWQDAIWFVIACSLYANIKSDWGAAEAADDTAVMDRLAEIERKLDLVLLKTGEEQW